MKKRKIINVESTSIGKYYGKNDDGIFIGQNFAAVIDGVSNRSTIEIDGKKVKMADIIIEAIKKIDGPNSPQYAKELDFKEYIMYINMYIRKYCKSKGYELKENELEATAAIYSKHHNQIWMVGDCRAVYDGNLVQNELEIDKLYIRP